MVRMYLNPDRRHPFAHGWYWTSGLAWLCSPIGEADRYTCLHEAGRPLRRTDDLLLREPQTEQQNSAADWHRSFQKSRTTRRAWLQRGKVLGSSFIFDEEKAHTQADRSCEKFGGF